MNIKHFAAAIAITLSSCTSDYDADRRGATIFAPQFALPTSAAGTAAPDTKASKTTLPVGLYIYKDADTDNAPFVANRKYTTADRGETWSSDEEVLYWDNLGDSVAVQAYAPYNADGIDPANFSVAADQSTPEAFAASDLLVSERPYIFTATTNERIKLKHAMTRIDITLRSTLYTADEIQSATVKFLGIKPTLRNAAAAGTPIDIAPLANGAVRSIAFPTQPLAYGSNILSIAIGGDTYTVKLMGNYPALISGGTYTANVNIASYAYMDRLTLTPVFKGTTAEFVAKYKDTNINDLPSGALTFTDAIHADETFEKNEALLTLLQKYNGSGKTFYIEMPLMTGSIGDEAFSAPFIFLYCDAFVSFRAPMMSGSIGENAFMNCNHLATFHAPSMSGSIGKQAFAACFALTSFGVYSAAGGIGQRAFAYCSHLPSINLYDMSGSIGNAAFEGCNALTSLTLGAAGTAKGASIGTNAFNLFDADKCNLTFTATPVGTISGSTWTVGSQAHTFKSITVEK